MKLDLGDKIDLGGNLWLSLEDSLGVTLRLSLWDSLRVSLRANIRDSIRTMHRTSSPGTKHETRPW